MPGLEESPKPMQLVTTPDSEAVQQTIAHEEENQPMRETTQTDELNNRLLKSFLNRMNAGDFEKKFENHQDDLQNTSGFED